MNNLEINLSFVLSSPSGAGKTTLSKKIQQSDSTFRISVSHTTRKARPNEVDGVDYHFVSKDEFKILLKKKLSMSTQKFLVITTELQSQS